MLDLNITLVFQLINFFIAILLLNYLLIRPVREIIKKRNDIMDQLAEESDHFYTEAVDRLEDYEGQLAKARQEAGKNREEGKSEALAELQAIVGEAEKSAKEMLEENRKFIHRQAEEALAQLRDGIDNFSTKLGNKLLGADK